MQGLTCRRWDSFPNGQGVNIGGVVRPLAGQRSRLTVVAMGSDSGSAWLTQSFVRAADPANVYVPNPPSPHS